MSQFKAGDLALVISGGFLGQVIVLERFVSPGDEIISRTTGKLYQFRPAAGVGGWLCAYSEGQVIKHEKNLMPLRGDFQPEQHKSLEVVE